MPGAAKTTENAAFAGKENIDVIRKWDTFGSFHREAKHMYKRCPICNKADSCMVGADKVGSYLHCRFCGSRFQAEDGSLVSAIRLWNDARFEDGGYFRNGNNHSDGKGSKKS